MPQDLNFRPQRKPNVIWIFGDQHRAQALSYRGDPNVFTPNIDNLARNGMRFDNAVAGAPWCTPFRGALLTGAYPHQNGATRTPSPLDPSWEESIRIPFIAGKVGGPDNMRVGTTDVVLNHVDIAPTTLGLCGLPVPPEMVGHDYSGHCIRPDAPEYCGEPDRDQEPDSAYLQQIPRKMHNHSVNKAWRGVVTRDRWKYVCTPGNDWLLFNTAEDPYEQANYVYDRFYQDQKERCHGLLARWIEATGDTFPLPDISLSID